MGFLHLDRRYHSTGKIPGTPLLAVYNWTYFGSLLGGYALITASFSLARIGEGTAGLLVSPNRGLLIFTPLAFLGLLGIGRAWLRPGRDPLIALFGLAALAHLLLMGSYRDWAGGWSFGPRYLVDVLPILGVAGVDLWPRLQPAGKAIAAVALVWSVLVQLKGAVCYSAWRWNVRNSPQLEAAAWNWRSFSLWEDFQVWWELRERAPRF